MLTLTENARAIVKELTTHPDAPESAGLRITATPEAQLAISAAGQPEAGDQVVEQDGATVYLDAAAAQELNDKVLDADVDESGALQFGLLQQG